MKKIEIEDKRDTRQLTGDPKDQFSASDFNIIKSTINNLIDEVAKKQSKEEGKSLSAENFTKELKEKIEKLNFESIESESRDLEYLYVSESRSLKESDKGKVLVIQNSAVVITVPNELSKKFNCYFTAIKNFNGRLEIGSKEFDAPNGLEITDKLTKSLGFLPDGKLIIRP
ncbi:hypothetical protein [Aureivirga marina]|uniref:hypothetical protein n=1 Tax=Aureivirga marina TaxID=1182451 RepID=UPI0018C97560|nr:hypothetical protein [Aureivirga marina]